MVSAHCLFSLSSSEGGEGRGEEALLRGMHFSPAPLPLNLRSADFSPPRSSPPKTAGSGLKSALLSCRNSLNSTPLLSGSLPARSLRGESDKLLVASCNLLKFGQKNFTALLNSVTASL